LVQRQIRFSKFVPESAVSRREIFPDIKPAGVGKLFCDCEKPRNPASSKRFMWGQPPSAVQSSEARQGFSGGTTVLVRSYVP
jgi:hypothetical protein